MLGSHEGVATEVVVRPDDAETTPVVRARPAVHPGVMVTVGYAILQVTSEMPGASFWSADNEVVTLGPGADEAELARRRESDAA